MKLITGMLLITLLYGCSDSGGETKKTKDGQITGVIIEQWEVIGDSNCFGDSWPDMLGIKKNCEPGRYLGFIDWEPGGIIRNDEYDIPERLILALGTNNLFLGTSSEEFVKTYQAYIDQASEVICILPVWDAYHNEIKSVCNTVVESPIPNNPDGLHFTPEDARILADRVAPLL